MPQVITHDDGSFTLHALTEFPGKRRVTCYYDKEGKLYDSEYRDSRMNIRSLRARDDLNRARGIGLAHYLKNTEAGREVWANTCAQYGVPA